MGPCIYPSSLIHLLADSQMMQRSAEELRAFPSAPTRPRPVPPQPATRQAGDRGGLPGSSHSVFKGHLLTRRYAGCSRQRFGRP